MRAILAGVAATGLTAMGLAAMGAAGAAQAATMTFDGIGYVSRWSEDGIEADGDGTEFGGFFPDMAHLDDGGSPFAREVTLTMSRPFDAVSFALEGFEGSDPYLLCDLAFTACEPVRYDDVLVTGLRGGEVVAQAAFDSTTTSGVMTLGAPFARLDALVFGFGPSPLELGSAPEGFEYYCPSGSPCSHYSVDDVVLAPIPLPAAAGTSALGLAALTLLRRRPAPRAG